LDGVAGVRDGSLWQLADPDLVVRRWPDEPECVVFSPLSGEVHLLNLPALALLESLGRSSRSTTQLAQALARTSGEDDEWLAGLLDALTMLDRAGLIEPRDP
jgi:PqqD family protein of HPr-rel-A system